MSRTRNLLICLGVIGSLTLALAVGCDSAHNNDSGDDAAPRASGSPSVGSASEPETLSDSGEPDGDLGSASGDSSAGAPADGGQLPQTAPKLQGILDRKIVQSTSIDLAVEDVGRDFQEIIRIAETAGGFVSTASFSNRDEQQAADLTIRVPANQYQSVLAQIRNMGEVQEESSDANDATEEYTDLQARLRTLQATERRYLELLAEARNINDILQVQDRLDAVRAQIEQVQGRINLLDHLTELATITVHLRPVVPGEPPADQGGASPLEAAGAAWERSLAALRVLATGVVVVGVFSWWLAPALLALALAGRWWLGRRPQEPSTAR